MKANVFGSASKRAIREQDAITFIKFAFALASLCPMLYLLSIRPATVLVERDAKRTPAAKRFYAPIIWLNHNTALRGPIQAYCRLWNPR